MSFATGLVKNTEAYRPGRSLRRPQRYTVPDSRDNEAVCEFVKSMCLSQSRIGGSYVEFKYEDSDNESFCKEVIMLLQNEGLRVLELRCQTYGSHRFVDMVCWGDYDYETPEYYWVLRRWD